MVKIKGLKDLNISFNKLKNVDGLKFNNTREVVNLAGNKIKKINDDFFNNIVKLDLS